MIFKAQKIPQGSRWIAAMEEARRKLEAEEYWTKESFQKRQQKRANEQLPEIF